MKYKRLSDAALANVARRPENGERAMLVRYMAMELIERRNAEREAAYQKDKYGGGGLREVEYRPVEQARFVTKDCAENYGDYARTKLRNILFPPEQVAKDAIAEDWHADQPEIEFALIHPDDLKKFQAEIERRKSAGEDWHAGPVVIPEQVP